MKHNKKRLFIIILSVLSLVCLTGCMNTSTKSNGSNSKTVVSSTSKKSKEELKANVKKEVLGITESGDYVIKLTNNNDEQFYIEDVSIRFFDSDGNFVKKVNAKDSYFCIPANGEVVTYAWGYGENFQEYSRSEIEILTDSPFYKYKTENFNIETSDTGREIAITVTNNNDIDLDCISVNVVYIKDEKVVGIENGISYEEGITSNGGKAYINVNYPHDSRYHDVAFEKYEVYIVSAYKM